MQFFPSAQSTHVQSLVLCHSQIHRLAKFKVAFEETMEEMLSKYEIPFSF